MRFTQKSNARDFENFAETQIKTSSFRIGQFTLGQILNKGSQPSPDGTCGIHDHTGVLVRPLLKQSIKLGCLEAKELRFL